MPGPGLVTDRPRPSSPWRRRALSFPLYTLVGAVALVGAPLWLVIAVLMDGVGGGALRWPRTRALGFFGLYLVCECLGIVAASCIWLVTAGGRVGGRARFLGWNGVLQQWWANALFYGSVTLFSMKVHVEGGELGGPGPLLLLVRHSSTADTVLAAALVSGPARMRLRYIIKEELLWDPCLDVVGRRLPNAFVARGSAHRDAELAMISALARGLGPDEGVLIYPEGTRFSPARRDRAVAKLAASTRRSLVPIAEGYRAVLPPKVAGVLALLAAAPDADVVFLEHTGFEGAATFADFWSGALIGRTVSARLRRFPAPVGSDEDKATWLFQRWAEVDGWICGVLAAEGRVP